ncbi:hypothetical protein CF065_13110 [Clostridium sporogenes]
MEKINVAIIISVSEYKNLSQLPGCKNDFRLMLDLIKAVEKYDEILEIHENTTSTKVKEKLTNFFMKIQDYDVNELFFYYTGHGTFDGKDLKFALNDYSSEKLNATTLSNDSIDEQIRAIDPQLTVKVIDTCHSGVHYIKGDSNFKQVFGQKKDIKNCYFMFSSHSNQFSYADKLSYFTKSFCESVLNYEGDKISYTSIIDYIKDSFNKFNEQTPFFVNQGTMTDMFCTITDPIKNIDISNYMNLENDGFKDLTDLVGLVKKRSELYLTKEEIENILIEIKSNLSKLETLNNFSDLFDLEIEEVKNYSDILGIKTIAKWVDENPNDYFIEIKKDKILNKEDKGGIFSVYTNLLSPIKYEAVDISTKLDVTFDTLKLKAKPKFPAILPYQCNIVFLLSKYDMTVFYSFISFVETGWEIYNHGEASNWNNFHMLYQEIKDDKGDLSNFNKIIEEFNNYIECDIKNRL